MKKITLLCAVLGLLIISGCEGPDGPPGPIGPAGIDGQDGGFEAEVFEVTTNFTANANENLAYRSFYDLNPAILAQDNLLIYQLAAEGPDVWKLLPQIYYFDAGQMQYNYDFTTVDFSIFIDATFDRATLSSEFLNNKTFRIVVVPGYFSKTVDVNNFDAVKSKLKLTDEDFSKERLRKISK